MEVLVARGAGLDVHRDFVEACAVLGPKKTDIRRQRFSTFRSGLEQLRQWLMDLRCTHVAMESTSVYWRPVYDVLDGNVEIVVCNAQHVKNVPGRKTDVTDAQWLGTLLRYGLIAHSYVPSRPLRELRELTRHHTKLVHCKTGFMNRTHKTLQIGGIKLSSVASQVFGVSGRLMIEALIEGEKSPGEIAALAKGALRKKLPQLEAVFDQPVSEHRRALLAMQLREIDRLDAALAEVECLMQPKLKPYEDFLERVAEMPGADRKAATILLAEIGLNMAPWQNDFRKLAAWAGVAPGNKQSANKKERVRTRDGNLYVKTILVEIAQAAVRCEGGRFALTYNRDKRRLGAKRALVKIAHAWLRCFFFMMLRDERYRENSVAELDQANKQRQARRLLKRLTELGFHATVSTLA